MKRLLVVLACVVLVPVGCGGPQPEPTQAPTLVPAVTPTEVPALVPSVTPTEVPTLVPAVTPTEVPVPTFTVAPGSSPDKCPVTEVETFANEMDKMDSEFRDIWQTADATAGASLSPLVQDLQRIRSKMAEIEYPQCLMPSFQGELNGMDMVIEAFLASMQDEPDWYVQVYLQEVDGSFALAHQCLEAVRATGTPFSSECSAEAIEQTTSEVSKITVEASSALDAGEPLPSELVSGLLLIEAPECLKAYVQHTYEFLNWSGKLRECQKENASCPDEELAVKAHSQVAYWKLSEAWALLVAVL